MSLLGANNQHIQRTSEQTCMSTDLIEQRKFEAE
jgi:hypothetical protein